MPENPDQPGFPHPDDITAKPDPQVDLSPGLTFRPAAWWDETSCRRNILPGEPYFVLRAKDRLARLLVLLWVIFGWCIGVNRKKLLGALRIWRVMGQWGKRNGTKTPD